MDRWRLSGPSLRTFLAIVDLWDLTDEQRSLVLGLPSRSRFRAWAAAARERRDLILGVDVLTRISAFPRIHQALFHLTEHNSMSMSATPQARSVPASFGGRATIASPSQPFPTSAPA
jgi:hypothetical protein